MEMLRTIIVAIIFAGITVFSYYFLSSSPFPWESPKKEVAQSASTPAGSSLPVPKLEDSEPKTFAQDSPFSPAPAVSNEEDVNLPGLEQLPEAQVENAESHPGMQPGEISSVPVAVSSEPPAVSPVIDTDLPSLDESSLASPFDAVPAPVQASSEMQVGTDVNRDMTSAIPSPEEASNFELPPGPPLSTEAIEPAPDLSTGPALVTEPTDSLGVAPTLEETSLPASLPAPAVDTGLEAPVPSASVPSAGFEASASTPSGTSQASGQIVNPLRGGPGVMPTTVPPVASNPSVSNPSVLPERGGEITRQDSETVAVREYLKKASEKIQNDEALEVLRELSKFYGNPHFSAEESSELLEILVQAATQVIYSQKSYMEPAYIVQAGDTLEKIAMMYEIPEDFILRVNGLTAGAPLTPGTQLKVVRGPFHAIVYLDRHEMLLTLNGLFAGRFWIGVGGELVQQDGDFVYVPQSVNSGDVSGMTFEFLRTAGAPGCADSVKIQATSDSNVIGGFAPVGGILMSQLDVANLTALFGLKSRLIMRCHSPKPVVQQTLTQSASAVPPTGATGPIPTASDELSVPSVSTVSPSVGTAAGLPGELPSELPGTLPPPVSEPASGELPLELPASL